jgi:hypothetical protein
MNPNMTTENFNKFIEQQVDAAVDLIFGNAHGYAMTTSGDITPEQVIQLDKIKEELKTLVYNQVSQNLSKEQETVEPEEMRQWNVPVIRIGYAHHLIAVSARTEEEAIEKALDEAGGEEFSEKSSEYEAPDGAHLIQ